MLCNATPTLLAMLASKRFPNHAVCTEVFSVVFPQRQQLVNNRLLLRHPSQFRNVTGVLDHAVVVEEQTQKITATEEDIRDWRNGKSRYLCKQTDG